ncbi:hypothetical protein [Streptomyces sp. NPDC002845]
MPSASTAGEVLRDILVAFAVRGFFGKLGPKAEPDLERWLDRRRLLAGRVRLVPRSGGAAWERSSFTAAESKWAPAVPSCLRLLQAYHAAVTSQLEQDDGLGLEIHR